jgi:hypothetical protein
MGCDCSKEKDKDKDLTSLYSKYAVTDPNNESKKGMKTKKGEFFINMI